MSKQIILLVEDNQDDVDLTLRVLKKHHIANEVIVALDGAAALKLLFEESVMTHAFLERSAQAC